MVELRAQNVHAAQNPRNLGTIWRFGAVGCALIACAPRPASRPIADAAREGITASDDVTASPDGPPRAPLTLGFAGDVAFTEGLAGRAPLDAVRPWFEGVSQAWVNLETVVSEPDVGDAAVKDFVFRSPPETLSLLRAAGVDGVSLANNHALDYGVEGLTRTLELCDAAGVLRAGAGLDHGAAYRPARAVIAGRSVAVFGFYRMNCEYPWVARRGRAGIASAWHLWEDETVEAVEGARRRGDLVVVMVHWGTERAPCPDRWQRALAGRWARAGASLVVGSHPHVLQGVERLHGAWVLYSTGNFAFPMAHGASAQTAFFEARFDGERRALRARPAVIDDDGRPSPASEAVRREVLATLSRRSHALRFNDAGEVEPSTASGECLWPRLDP